MIRIIAALMILNTSALAEPVPSVQFLEDSATQVPIILDPLPLADIVSYRYVPRILVFASGLEREKPSRFEWTTRKWPVVPRTPVGIWR